MADSISEITTSQRSKDKRSYKGTDIFDNSTLEEVEELESTATNNKNNEFYDTLEAQQPTNTNNQVMEDEETNTKPPYLDNREIDEDTEYNINKASDENSTINSSFNEHESTIDMSDDDDSEYNEEESCGEERSERLLPKPNNIYNLRSTKNKVEKENIE